MENLPSDNIDIGVALYKAVGYLDSENPLNVQKLKEIASFFENRPGGSWEIKSVVGKKTNQDISNLDHLLTYVSINKRVSEINKEKEALERELKYYV